MREIRLLAIIRKPWFTWMVDPASEILLEMVEPKDVGFNEAAVERFLDQDFQVAHAEHRNRALPADPHVILPLRL